MNIIPIPAFKDNYIWMIPDENSKTAWIVDPGDANPVIEELNKRNWGLAGILITHHHYDHSGGIEKLIENWKNIPVIGSHTSSVTHLSQHVKERDEVKCHALTLKVLEIPGHTLDHVAFYNENILFCGDTLFSAGCGRVFEGTPEQMYGTLNKLSALPPDINIYCGHEYTLANLQFAKLVEPDNQFISQKLAAVTKLRHENWATLPSCLSDEKKMNPFLRCQEPAVISAVESYVKKQLDNPVAVFAHLREWKNSL